MDEQERDPIARLTGPTPEEVKQKREAEAQVKEEQQPPPQDGEEDSEGKETLDHLAEDVVIRKAAKSLLKSQKPDNEDHPPA